MPQKKKGGHHCIYHQLPQKRAHDPMSKTSQHLHATGQGMRNLRHRASDGRKKGGRRSREKQRQEVTRASRRLSGIQTKSVVYHDVSGSLCRNWAGAGTDLGFVEGGLICNGKSRYCIKMFWWMVFGPGLLSEQEKTSLLSVFVHGDVYRSKPIRLLTYSHGRAHKQSQCLRRKSQEKLTEERTRNGDMFTTPNAGLFSVDASFMIRASDASRADSPRPERLGSGAEQADVNIKHR
ncbi:hypothetical protein D8B26_000576 [Coccidioides posadasii str. Silveira]|uniref:Predicted protein n=2 Tax=Coccidioides posadasii TaxID=199306 RepID=E9DF98_COCPS|nr:predicted protein [Coccidioides posadasii str. Silveira]KMM63660.1 hypothetical protein CPAG_00014 [Coccidioides posadasii RMSCC 3488]QVM05869.1 hypothetical protein D8B26_000576 [Coccidioides posadasii str. Silveira]